MPERRLDFVSLPQKLCILLEGIQDPGNLGTIIRIADWFGIDAVLCTKGCVDLYNPKVVQATMGSLLRVPVYYIDIPLLHEATGLNICGAILGGDDIFEQDLPATGIIAIGNEGAGLSKELESILSHKLTIPKYGGAESLNAAVATGIICALFRKP